MNKELKNWKETPGSWIRRHDIKMSVLPDIFYRFSSIPVKIPARYFVDINKLISKFIGRSKRLREATTMLKEKNFTYLTLTLIIIYSYQESVELVKKID